MEAGSGLARRALAHLGADCFTCDLRLRGSMWLRTGGREDNVYAAGIHKRARGRERGREGLHLQSSALTLFALREDCAR